MGPDTTRPQFRHVAPTTTYVSPEELFYKLSGRQATHGYLRGPQQDVLREYSERCSGAPDIAFELPTGTGKTAVGLLIAEWKRLAGSKVAFLSLTNQLSGQVLVEATRLGVSAADLRGTKDTRDPAEEGRYRTGSGIAVTTYSNLFNVNPVINEADLIVFDDAHGAEQYAANMWTASVGSSQDPSLYNALLTALRPGFSESQVRAILDKSSVGGVEMPDVHGHPECIPNVVAVLDQATADSVRFPWKLIRNRLRSCLFLASRYEITIRPLVPPTHTHAPFAAAKQRIYMSATLGGESDLQRAYGIGKLEMIRAKTPQWGRRYIFIPGVYANEAEAGRIVAGVWDGMNTRRAVLLAPSDRAMNRAFGALEAVMVNKPTRLGPTDIAETIDGFVNSTDVILALAARYDGLDLPDEQCRLLLMAESPAAVNPLERHLSERWKMGPVLRRRERTRLVQGMGRCTRNATDFAVIMWMGQSLVNAATSPAVLGGLPPELAAEITWGVEQSELAPGELVNMILGLIADPEYRKAADAEIQGIQAKQPQLQPKDYEEAGRDEVRYAKEMWDENFGHAYEIAHSIVDRITSPELAGYRGWWNYLAGVAASLAGNKDAERDCLARGAKCGVNSGWLNRLLHQRGTAAPPEKVKNIEPNAEGLWDVFTVWGWAGPTFEQKIDQMLEQLKDLHHAAYHEGLEALGRCFGAKTTRITEQGAPDVVWSFDTDFHVAFEAKTGKKPSGALSKGDVQEAKGHPDWVRDRLCQNPATGVIASVIVAPSPTVHQIALPFAGDLHYIAPARMLKLAERVADTLRKLRVTYVGREFAEAAVQFSAEMRNAGLDLESLRKVLLSERLKK